MSNRDDFGPWLKREVESRGWTQKATAEVLGVPRSTFGGWTSGASIPEPDDCDAIAELFGLEKNDVRRRAGRPLLRAGEPEPLPSLPRRTNDHPTDYDDDYLAAAELAEFVTANADKLTAADRRRTYDIIRRFLETGEGGEEIQP